MVTSNEHCRYAAAVHSLCKHLNETCCLVVVFRVINAISVEYYKIIINILNLLKQRVKNMFSLVQIIKNKRSKAIRIILCSYK